MCGRAHGFYQLAARGCEGTAFLLVRDSVDSRVTVGPCVEPHVSGRIAHDYTQRSQRWFVIVVHVTKARRSPLLFGLCASTLTHGSLMLALLLRLHPSTAGGSGAQGHAGAGDTAVDVSVAGATTPAPMTDAPAATEAPPKPTNEPGIATRVSPPPSRPVTTGNARETHTGALAGPTRIGAPMQGLGGDTIEGQRSLLPGAVTCKDSVAGRWEALKYNPRASNWVRFTLLVHRSAVGAIQGTIVSHTWGGGEWDCIPPSCGTAGYDMTFSMNATGRDDAQGRITFGSSSYSVAAVRCPSWNTLYAPDNFSGTVDAARQEFQSVNNDGAFDVNAPYVFRRTGCLD